MLPSRGSGQNMSRLTEEQKKLLRPLFDSRPESLCADCGGYHLRACGRVKRQVWVGQGMSAGVRTEVEYWPQWDDSETVYPEDVFDDTEDEVSD